ncbi:hypothetical protein RhiLY_07630 [Ceratobasidium sp. AG-Ba]|nr:hypothetical protein RhiLY_07630 [Ceratobasidium sp. AG-Ba]
MLCGATELERCQTLLRVFILGHFQTLEPTSEDRVLPPLEQILDHVAEPTDGMAVSECMLRTMQLVTDFCHADPSKYQYMRPEPVEAEELPEWATKLQAIKDNFKPSRADAQHLEDAISEAEAEIVNNVAASAAATGSRNGGDAAEGSLGPERVDT